MNCNGIPTTISGGAFPCSISLTRGVNLAVVQAVDIAGNVSAVKYHLTLDAPLPAPTSLTITPDGANMLIGDTQQFTAVDEQGHPRPDAIWSVDDVAIATLPVDGSPILTGVAAGQVTLTATIGAVSAQTTVHVLGSATLPVGTVRWSVQPSPGFSCVDTVQAAPSSGDSPDLYCIESANDGPSGGANIRVKAVTSDGRQLWERAVLGDIGYLPYQIADQSGGLLLEYYDPDGNLRLADLDALTGLPVWTANADGITAPLAVRPDGSMILKSYIDSDFSNVWVLSLDGNSGQMRPLLVDPSQGIAPPTVDSDGATYL